MAKKKEDKTSNLKLAEVARNALNALGVDAKIADVENYIKREHPGYSYNRLTLAATLSGQRKRLGGAGNGSSRRRGAPSTREAEPSSSELLTVKELADAEGGLDKIRQQIAKVDEMAAKVGGINRLKRSLDVLEKLSIR